ncbi:MAG: glycosyltransferase family 4 protein [Deltaproteobacteria bacterium]|nr:glycosyltransferase family 4 protein [Deltaproteobacteria bacterium]
MTRARPRLLLLSPLPPPAGGIASWTERLLESDITRRYEVRVLNTNAGLASTQHPSLSWSKVKTGGRVLGGLARELVRARPDVVHVNTSGWGLGIARDLGVLALARAVGARTVLHFRGSRFTEGAVPEPTMRRALRGVRRVDLVLALNRPVLDTLRSRGVERAQQINNFIPRRPQVEREHRPEGKVRVLYVGWVMPAKGILELLEAVAGVDDAELTLLGRFVDGPDGSSEALVRDAIARLGLGARVQLAGEVPLAQVWSHYEQADVFALPSWTEGFPNVLLESMMSGLPAVATPVGAIPEVIVDGETGLLVPVRDAAGLRDALARLVGDRALRLRMGAAARERALARYEMGVVLGGLADLYDGLLAIDTRGDR